jgi:copper chaperone CopZ
VSRTDASFRAKEAVIVFDPAQVTVEQMLEAVNALGFRAKVKAP